MHLHHAALCPTDLEASLRFWRDGIGLTVLMDHHFDGDWRTLFGAATARLHSIFLGDPRQPNTGVVELVVFEAGDERAATTANAAASASFVAGFFLLSFYVDDINDTVARLDGLGVLRDLRRITVPGARPDARVDMATVRDPDGVLVELIAGASA